MKLFSLFKEETVLIHPNFTDFVGTVRGLLECLGEDLPKTAADSIAKRLLDRESEHPTVIGEDACIIHMRIEEIKILRVAVALLQEPIRHPADPDQKLATIFLALTPLDQNTLMLQTLAAISRLLMSKAFRSAFRGIRAPGRLIRLIEESGVDVKRTLTAGDIMEPIDFSVTMDTPLPEAVETLGKSKDEGLPVIDDKGHLVGEITSKEILVLGMPKYMDLLSNPEMLNAFEPFENYFRNGAKTTVRDICRRDFVTVAPTDPIVRVAHQMITNNRRRVYVLDDGKIEGVIYRKSIVERVMNR